MITSKSQYDAMFSGVIGQDYDTLNLICPLATEMSRLVGIAVSDYAAKTTDAISAL